MKFKNLALAISLVALTACDGGDKNQQNPELLKGQNYITTTTDGVDITLSFDANDMRAFGRVVNRYNGPYTADTNGNIDFGPMASTMMMGPENAMKAESAHFKFLESAQLYKLDGGILTIKDANGNTVEFKTLEAVETPETTPAATK